MKEFSQNYLRYSDMGVYVHFQSEEEMDIDDFIEKVFDEAYKKGREDENIAFLNGERCTDCGREKEFSKHSETCKKCWEEE